jgi:hypothetical protein
MHFVRSVFVQSDMMHIKFIPHQLKLCWRADLCHIRSDKYSRAWERLVGRKKATIIVTFELRLEDLVDESSQAH